MARKRTPVRIERVTWKVTQENKEDRPDLHLSLRFGIRILIEDALEQDARNVYSAGEVPAGKVRHLIEVRDVTIDGEWVQEESWVRIRESR